MALMIPDNIYKRYTVTPGEKRVHTILKDFPDNNIGWFEVVYGVRHYKPDFILLDPDRGIIILEVKDWGKSSILDISVEEDTFTIRSTGNLWSPITNPITKCDVYSSNAIGELITNKNLVSGDHQLKFPVKSFVVFPNLSEDEFDSLHLERMMNKDRVLFQSHVNNRTKFLDMIHSSVPKMENEISPEMISTIRSSIKQENTIAVPSDNLLLSDRLSPRIGTAQGKRETLDVFAIDIEQEALAKNLGEGPRLLRGIAGTGKTLIMLMRAKLLVSNAEAKKEELKVLVLCWNISLANYMRQAYEHINIPVENNKAEIVHFAKFATDLILKHRYEIKSQIDFDFNNEEYITQLLNEISIKTDEKFDIVIIDEAQDFEDEWIKYIHKNLIRGENADDHNLMLAADDAQRIYKSRNFTWASLGINLTGRSKILRKIYRNSARVWGFAGLFIDDISQYYDGSADVEFTPKRGVDPRLVKCKTHEDQISKCIEEIKNIGDDFSWRHVMVIYRGKITNDRYPIILKLMQSLEKEKIPAHWITESKEDKLSFLWAEDSVKVSTAHSAKGLDAPKVIIIAAESFDQGQDISSDETKLMYVALTRAREEIVILYKFEEGLVPKLLETEEKYKKHKEWLLSQEIKATQ